MNIRATHVAFLTIALLAPTQEVARAQASDFEAGVALLLEDGAINALDGIILIKEGRTGSTVKPGPLGGIKLSPIDFSNRTRLQEFLTDRPRRSTDAGDSGRLILPAGAGSLYAYQRDANDAVLHGLMHVAADGNVRSILELNAIGQDEDVSPLLSKVAVAADGLTILAATTPSAGGDLFVIDITSGSIRNLTANLSAQEFKGEGLALGDGWGFGVCTTGALRFTMSSTATAEFVTFPEPQPAYFACEAALSANGLHAVTIAGGSETATQPFAFSTTGAARCADSTASHMHGAGYLPGSLDGPFLAINNAGDDCAWVSVEGNSRELYFGKTPLPTPVETQFHITQDALFHPYLDEIGLLSFELGKLIFSAGDRRDPILGGLTFSSYYRADRGAPGTQPSLLDLAHLYESAQPPFVDYTSLDPVSVHMTPSREAYIVYSMAGDIGEVSGVRLNGHSGQLFTLLPDVESVQMMEVAGDRVLMSVQQENTAIENQLFTLPVNLDQLPSALLSLPDEDVDARTAQGSGIASFVTPDENGSDTLWFVGDQGSTPRSLTLNFGEFGETLAVTKLGSLVFTITIGERGEMLFIWPQKGRPQFVLKHEGSIQILPGS